MFVSFLPLLFFHIFFDFQVFHFHWIAKNQCIAILFSRLIYFCIILAFAWIYLVLALSFFSIAYFCFEKKHIIFCLKAKIYLFLTFSGSFEVDIGVLLLLLFHSYFFLHFFFKCLMISFWMYTCYWKLCCIVKLTTNYINFVLEFLKRQITSRQNF